MNIFRPYWVFFGWFHGPIILKSYFSGLSKKYKYFERGNLIKLTLVHIKCRKNKKISFLNTKNAKNQQITYFLDKKNIKKCLKNMVPGLSGVKFWYQMKLIYIGFKKNSHYRGQWWPFQRGRFLQEAQRHHDFSFINNFGSVVKI